MARGLIYAATLSLCVMSMGSMRADVVPAASAGAHIGAGSIAAGRAHTVIAKPDGRVFAWGAGGRGQLGVGGFADRWSPTLVPDLVGIVAVGAGAAHTVALSTGGDVFSWGANTDGRLGDGTRKRRDRPVRVAGLVAVKAIAAGRAHTLALTADGRVFAWGLNANGQIGNGRKAAVLTPVQVPLTDIVAIAAGNAHSLAVTRDGRLFAWGRNDFSTLGDGTTKDRATPVMIGLQDVVSVAAGGAHSLALLRSGAVYSWGRGAGGELGTGSTKVASTPKMIPGLVASAIDAGRHFSGAITTAGQVLTWGANASGQLGDGTTVRRLRPVPVIGGNGVTSLALGAVHGAAVTAEGDIRTWGEGELGRLGSGNVTDHTAPVEIISDVPDWGSEPGGEPEPIDAVPPRIRAVVSPELHEGWMTDPVSVAFECEDDIAIASCSAPMVVRQDGSTQVTGTAVDRAGNRSTTSVTINLDLQPPSLTVVDPVEDTTHEAEEVVVSGTIADLASGVTEATCNGAQLAIAGGAFQCAVHLHPGRNDIVIDARDAVGREASTAVTVSRVGAPTELFLTPAARTVGFNEVARLTLRDQFGAVVERAAWRSDDDTVVTVSGDEPPVLTAVGLGATIVVAEKDGLRAEALIRVVPDFTPGDERWRLPASPLLTAEPPVFANRVAPDSPFLFAIDSEDWDKKVVRAVSEDGEVLWQQYLAGVPFLGDAFGGVVAGIPDAIGDFRALVRIGSGTTKPWRYTSPGIIERPAQASDGTLYAVETLPAGGVNPDGHAVTDKFAVVIDGATGRLLSRTRFTRDVNEFISAHDGEVIHTVPPVFCRSYRYETAPETVGPVAGADGKGYFVVRRHKIIKRDSCNEPLARRPDRTIEMGIDLIAVSRTSPAKTTAVYSTACTAALGTGFPCDHPARAVQLMPDGIGGTLVTWERGTQMVGPSVFVQKSMTRVETDGTIAERNVDFNFSIEMVGQSGVALTYGDGWKAMDVTNGDVKWSGLLSDLTPLAARPDNGVAAFDWNTSELAMVNASGEIESRQPFALDYRSVNSGGSWVGLKGEGLASVTGAFDDATRWSPFRGDAQGRLTVRRPGMGISVKSHSAVSSIPVFHSSIKIAPINQSWMADWYAARPQLTPVRDLFKNLYITLGAGLPNGQDTTVNCFVPGADILVSEFNRDGDLNKPAKQWTDVPVAEADEAAAIQRLLDYHERYSDNAPYACFPDSLSGFYNSNSYARSLLEHASLRPNGREPKTPSPGWRTIIPKQFFPPR